MPAIPPVKLVTEDEDKDRHSHARYAAETSGLIVIALLLLAIELVRYWQYIRWSAR